MPSNEKWRKSQYKQAILVVILLFALAGGVYGYAKYREVASLLPVTFERASGGESEKFYLEIASTPSTRKKGLMFRTSMGDDRGMLFIFPKERRQSFWMKNTKISLDIIFVSSQFEIVGVAANAPPMSEEKQAVPGVSQYVVELNAGKAAELGLEKGDKLKLYGKIPKPI